MKISLKKFTQEQIFPGIKNFTHQSFSQIININKTITKNRTSFAVVRNPYERFVSIYRFVNRPFKLKKCLACREEVYIQEHLRICPNCTSEKQKIDKSQWDSSIVVRTQKEVKQILKGLL